VSNKYKDYHLKQKGNTSTLDIPRLSNIDRNNSTSAVNKNNSYLD